MLCGETTGRPVQVAAPPPPGGLNKSRCSDLTYLAWVGLLQPKSSAVQREILSGGTNATKRYAAQRAVNHS